MTSFTLDTNCLIAVAENRRPDSLHVLRLIKAADDGIADVAMAASAAAENQPPGHPSGTIEALKERMATLGFGSIGLLRPIAVWNFSFWDYCVWADDQTIARQDQIFDTLFPGADRVVSEEANDRAVRRWRNQMCDVQAFWAHDYYERDVFVTTDGNFKKRLLAHEAFPGARIATPAEAVAELASGLGLSG